MLGKNKKGAKSNNGKGNSNGSFERRDMSGALFENNKKEKESQPDMTGVVKVDGVEYRVAAWMKETSKGDDWLSLSFSEFDEDYQKKDAPKSSAKKKGRKDYEETDEDDTGEEEEGNESEDESGEEAEDETDEEEDNEADEEDLTPPKKGSSKPKAATKSTAKKTSKR